MLSLTKMAPSSWTYYAEEIATGREDYYALSAERPGVFLGAGAEALGITALTVDATALERLFGNGEDPRDGSALGRRFGDDERAVAGFALTFSPPKSVSVLWALGDDDVSEAVADAQEAAVGSAVRFLEAHAAFTRRGHAGVLQVDTDGLLAASFVHRTSRAADPQLHTHLLVANKVRAADGRWLSLDARELYEHQKAAGMLYKAALRAELTARLGVSWTAVDDNGVAEIAGVPTALAEAWSARRKQVKDLGATLIAERSAELGRSLNANERARLLQIAAYRTRVPKVEADTPTAALKARWREEATACGHEPERWLAGVLGRARATEVTPSAELVGTVIARLEERSATFGRSDVVEECSRLVTGTDAETTLALVEELADAVLVDPAVVSLAAPLPLAPPAALRRRDQMAQFERHGGRRFSTTATLAREAAVLEAVASGASAGVGVVPEPVIENALAGSVLGDDQRRAVAGLLSDGARVSLLVGPAGAGKSRALEAAQYAWSASGARVFGLAPSAMAAAVLTEESGITSETLAKFLHGLNNHGLNNANPLRSRDVVVLDEAGMARTDDLARLVAAVESAQAKLVLVGDPQQLGAVGPGGLFRTLVGDHGAHELETVRRFDEAWEAAASLRLRARDTSVLVDYVRHDRISEGSRAAMVDAAFSTWAEARARGEELLVLAGDNATVDELARRCRAALVRAGEVERDGARLASGLAGVGDEVVTLRNDRTLRPSAEDFVRNGARWRVIDRHDDGALVVTALSGTGTVALPAAYVAEHVALAYALTIHKAQGATTERAVVLVDEQMSAAQLYVAMTRGREENRALVVTSDEERDDHVRGARRSGIEQLAAVMRNDGSDHSAHDVLRRELARSEDGTVLAGVRRAVEEQVERVVGPDLRRRIDQLAARDDRTAAERAHEGARRTLEHATARRETAQAALESVSSRRGWSPSRRAERSRLRDAAEESLGRARSGEAQALQAFAASEHHLADARARGSELDALRTRQLRRDAYLDEHRAEAAILAGRWNLASDKAAPVAAEISSASPLRPDNAGGARPEGYPPIGIPDDELPLRLTRFQRQAGMTL